MQFEYKQVVKANLLSQGELETLGDEEWELVCVTEFGNFLNYFFKRPKVVEVLRKMHEPLEKTMEN